MILLFKCTKDTKSINTRVSKTNNGKTVILSKCAICDSKKSSFIKKEKPSGILSNLGLNTPLNKISILSDWNSIIGRTASYKVLKDKAFNIAKNPKYDECQRSLTSIVYKFCDKKTSGCIVSNEIN